MDELFGPVLPSNIVMAARGVKNIRTEIARLSVMIKKLRETKKPLEKILFDYMTEKQLKQIMEIKLSSVRSKNSKRKTLKQKKEDAIELFRTEGLMDPESFWDKLQQTQKLDQTTNNDNANENIFYY